MDEHKLIVKSQKGDKVAFELLVETYEKQIYNYAYRLMNNQEDAMDMTQEALVKAYMNIQGFRLDSKFSTWLFRIVHNVCYDELRKRKRVTIISDDVLTEHVSLEPSPEEQYEQKDIRTQIAAALDGLTPVHKQAILLRDVNGFSYDEIASITGAASGTVKSRINRARQELREILIKKYGTSLTKIPSKQVKGGEVGEL